MQRSASTQRFPAITTIAVLAAIAAMPFALRCSGAHAQRYPAKAVRIIVPVAPGGATDIVTRTLGQRLAAVWGQQVLVDNRPGGGSNVGFEAASRAHADGYTLLMAQLPFAVNVSLYRKLNYDPLRDFAPVTLAATSASVLAVHPSIPARGVRDLITLAQRHPGQLTYASSGNGTSPHLSGELFRSMAKIDILHIPYKGAGSLMSDLLGGHVGLAFLSLPSVVPHLKANKLRALAITSPKRSHLMPDLPTFAEAALPGYEVMGWYGILAPAGTPREIISQLNTDIAAALAHPDVLQALSGVGLEPVSPNAPEAFTEYLRGEIVKWAKVVKVSGAKAD